METEDSDFPGVQLGMGTAYRGENPSARTAGKSLGVEEPDSPGVGPGDLPSSFPEW